MTVAGDGRTEWTDRPVFSHTTAATPPSSGARSRRILFLAAVILACRLASALALVPPWQQPDEQAQVAVVEVWRTRALGIASTDPGREAEILRSMLDNDWWRHYGRSTPSQVPGKFIDSDVAYSIGIDPTARGFPSPYYRTMGRLLAWLPEHAVVVDMYILRIVSALLAIVLLWAAWRASGLLNGHEWMTVPLLIALQPHVAIVGTSAGPDLLVAIAGTVVWWQALAGVTGARRARHVTALWLAAVVGASVDRVGVPLLGIALVLSFGLLLRRTTIRTAHVAAAVGATLLLAALLWQLDSRWLLVRSTFGNQLLPVPEARSAGFVMDFSLALVRTWWFSLGWDRYAPPLWWSAVAFFVSIAAAVGVVRAVIRAGGVLRAAAAIALVMMGVQVAAEYWAYFRIHHGPQGRHLIPMIGPAAMLLVLGASAAVPVRWRPRAPLVLVALVAALDTAATLFIVIPAYVG